MLPVLVDLPFFTLYSYPLFMGLSWGVGYYLAEAIFYKKKIAQINLLQLFIGLFVSAWLGAKIFFLIFSSNNLFYRHLNSESFWLGGGFVFYGGLIFGLIFFLFYSLVLKKFPFKYAGYLSPALAFGHALGRGGCFLAGCCFGNQCDLPWAISVHGKNVHPVQLYESLGLIIIGVAMLKLIRLKINSYSILGFYLLSYSVLRFTVELFRGDVVRGVYGEMLSTSQLISIALLIIGIVLITWKKLEKEDSLLRNNLHS